MPHGEKSSGAYSAAKSLADGFPARQRNRRAVIVSIFFYVLDIQLSVHKYIMAATVSTCFSRSELVRTLALRIQEIEAPGPTPKLDSGKRAVRQSPAPNRQPASGAGSPTTRQVSGAAG